MHPTHRRALGIALVLGASATAQITVNTADRAAVLNLFNTVWTPARANTNHGWTGSVAGCNPGSLNAQFVADSLTALNVYRAMAGLPNVTFGNPRSFATTWQCCPTVDCQQGALMMHAAGQLSHNLPANGPCGTVAGAGALQTSNLAGGLVGPGGIELLIDDSGVSSLGHRRWMLHEPQRQMAMGATDTYMTLAIGGATAPGNRSHASAWPPAGFVPRQWIYDTWSFSVPGVNQDPFNPATQANFANATVTVTRAGNNVPIQTWLPGQCIFCYDHAIAWTFNPPLQLTPGMADTPYTVTISNVGNTAQSTYSYVVTVFDPVGATPDECGGATLITNGTNGPFHNNTATTSTPAWPCASGGNDVWFRYTATCTGQTTFATCSPTLAVDSAIEVFSGACGSLVSLGCNDDTCNLGSSLTVTTTAGQTYRVRVGGYGGARGAFDVVVTPPACGAAFQTLNHHCGVATLNRTGPGTIGNTTTFTMANTTGVRVVFYGFTLLNNAAFCVPCTIGPDPLGMVLGPLPVAVPNNPSYVGVQLKVQGADLGGTGGCVAPLARFTDTIVWTIG